MLIDRYLPTFDESYICEVSVNASPGDAYRDVGCGGSTGFAPPTPRDVAR